MSSFLFRCTAEVPPLPESPQPGLLRVADGVGTFSFHFFSFILRRVWKRKPVKLDAFATGTPFLGTFLLVVCVGRGLGGSEGVKLATLSAYFRTCRVSIQLNCIRHPALASVSFSSRGSDSASRPYLRSPLLPHRRKLPLYACRADLVPGDQARWR